MTEGNMTYRFETFGGIIASTEPPFLAFVDRDYMRELGTGESPLWQGEETIGLLSAPTEVHFAVTNRCSVKCSHCYMASGDPSPGELSTDDFKRAIDALADMQVFHMAMGGGEALEREDLFEVASYAREKGMVPNLTIAGLGLTQKTASQLRIFGQINISLDGIGEHYSVFRDRGTFAEIDRALDLLQAEEIAVGINCVVGRRNFDGISDLVEYAASKNLNEVEFLRFKPLGRGKRTYHSERTTHQQNIALIPLLSEVSQRFGITAKIDCSFVPMLCYHKPPLDLLYSTATYGCEAGNVLLGIRSNGLVSGCSFLESDGTDVFQLPERFQKETTFNKERSVVKHVSEPCSSCAYLQVCKGGCHGVSEFVTGNFNAPDPECPSVVESSH